MPTPPPTLGELAEAARRKAEITAPGALYDPNRPRGFYVMRLSPQSDYSPMVIDYWSGRDWFTWDGKKDLRIMRVVKLVEGVE